MLEVQNRPAGGHKEDGEAKCALLCCDSNRGAAFRCVIASSPPTVRPAAALCGMSCLAAEAKLDAQLQAAAGCRQSLVLLMCSLCSRYCWHLKALLHCVILPADEALAAATAAEQMSSQAGPAAAAAASKSRGGGSKSKRKG